MPALFCVNDEKQIMKQPEEPDVRTAWRSCLVALFVFIAAVLGVALRCIQW